MSREERAKWNAAYRGGTDNPRVTGRATPLLDLLPDGPGIALDLACGPMRHGRALAARGWDVVAVDAAREAFRAGGPIPDRIHPLVADLDEWPLPVGRFDAVIDVHFLNRDLAPALARALKPGGWLLFEIRVDAENVPGAPLRPFRLAPGEAAALFPGLRIIESSEEMDGSMGLARYAFRAPSG